MANTVEVILEFLKKNNFRNAECALRAELSAMKGSASLAIDELPRPPPVKLQLGNDGNFESSRDGNSTTSFDSAIFLSMTNTPEGFFELGSFIDVPAGQDISSSGMKNSCGIPSVSQGMLEDVSDRLSGFATAGDGESAIDYGCQCWDSDTYEDDDDPGYHRQPIENEAWFLAHEIENPTEDELASSIKLENDCNLNEDVRSVMEEESSLFVENELRHAWKERVEPNLDALTVPDGNISSGHEGEFMSSKAPDSLKVMDSWHCLNRDIRAEVGNGQGRFDCPIEVGNSFLGATRSDDLLMNNSGSGEYMAGDSSEGDPREGETETLNSMQGTYWQSSSFQERLGACAISQLQSNDVAGSSVEDDYEEHFGHRSYYNEALFRKSQNLKLQLSEQDLLEQGSALVEMRSSTTNQRCKSEASSTSTSIESKETINIGLFERSNLSSEATNDYLCMETKDEGEMEEDINKERDCEDSVAPEDEEMAAVQDQIQRIGNDEDEYEIFDLKIIHRKNRTGFEEDKDLSVLINSVIAGRYHVSEYLGSAAFSKAVQAHDLHTGMDVCMKIIKNNKDFFDQSLDEIKLLKYVNKNDPADKHHILRLYDYFYHREHLFIVCELLRANLYEFQKFNKESGGEIYFTMPRLQSITRQCLEALEFLHGLGLIHCDLKPENILVKSYSRCEIKVIDLGSSCFQTDHLCSYVQSRSYRAPEVILGLPYDQKIDLWSLGCILAELCSGNVLFQNDSLATLLARMVGILGPMDPEMLAKGRDTHKYFTKNHVLYERIQETDQLEYILPKKTSLSHRLPLGDTGFVEFVGYLLQINPLHRPTAKEALKHPWLSHPYEPISS